MINASAVPGEGTSLNAGDSLTGGNGDDTLSIIDSLDASAALTVNVATGFALNSVEKVVIQNVDSDLDNGGAPAGITAHNYDFTNATGVKTVVASASTGSTTFSNLGAIVDTEITNSSGTTTVGYTAGVVVGSADAAKVTLNGAGTTAAAGFTSNGIETLNVVTAGTASGDNTANGIANGATVTLAGANIRTLNVSGDKALVAAANLAGAANTSAATAAKVDASTLTGNLDLNLAGAANGGGTQFLNVAAGKGDDVIRVATLNSNMTIAGGDGSDTLRVNALAGGTGPTDDFKNVSGFEKIAANGALAATYNLATAGNINEITLVNGAAAAGAGASGVASGVTLTYLADNTGVADAFTLTVNNATTSTTDVVNVNLGSSSTTTNIAAGTLNVAGVETLNVTSLSRAEIATAANAAVDAAGTQNHNLAITDAALRTLKVTASESLTLTSAGTAALNSVDASASTSNVNLSGLALNATAATVLGGKGSDSLVGGAGNDSLVGDAGNDTINGGLGNDVISGGDGRDTLIVSNGDATNDAQTSNVDGGAGDDRFVFEAAELTSLDTVKGGDGNNVLALTSGVAASALTDGSFTNVTGIQTITAAAVIGSVSADGTNNTAGTLSMTLNSRAQAAGVNTVAAQYNATTGATTGTNAIVATVQEGFTNALTFKLGDSAGTDNINAGATTATITISGNEETFDAAETLIGGSGANDKLIITANGQGVAAGANLGANVSGFEMVEVKANAATPGATASLTIGSAGILTSGKSLVVDASSLTTDTANFTFNGAAETLDATAANTGRFNVTSGAGADNITGGDGNDTVSSGAGADVINTNAGNDSVDAGAGADVINTGTGNDIVVAGAGNDTLTGGAGADNLTGGDGNDMFNYAAATGNVGTGAASDSVVADNVAGTQGNLDTIVGFNAGDGTVAGVVDQIRLPGATRGTQITTVNVGSANLTTFATDLAASGNLNTALASLNDVAVVTVAGGTAAGTYLVINTNGVAGYAATDTVIKMVDSVNLDKLSLNNFVVPPVVTFTQTGPDTFSSTAFTADADALTVNGGFISAAGTVDLLGGANVVVLQNTANTGATNYTATAGGTVSYTIDGTTAVTMKVAEAALIGSATGGANNVTLSGLATGQSVSSAVETVTLAAGTNSIATSGAQNITEVGAGATTLNISGNYSGTFTAAGTADTVVLATGANISLANIAAQASNLTIAPGGSVTMSKELYNQFNNAITAAGVGAAGETITMSNASTDGYTLNANVENFVLHSGNDAYVIGAAGQNVNLGAGTNALSSAAGVDVLTGTITGGGTDTYTWDDGDDLSGATTVGIDTYASTGDHTITLDEANMVVTAITGTNGSEGNVTFRKTGAGSFNLSAVAMTNINNIALVDAANGAISLTLDAADINEAMTLAGNAGGGVNTIVLNDTDDWSGFTVTNIDTVSYAATDANTTLTLSDAHFTASNYTTVSATTATSNLTIANADNSAVDLRNTAISGFDAITTGAADAQNANITIDAASFSNAAAFTLSAGSTDNLLVTEDVTLTNMTVTTADLDSVGLSNGVDLVVSQNFLSSSIVSVTGTNAGDAETFKVTASAAASAIDISNIATITDLGTLAVEGGTGNNTITLSTTDAVRKITTVDISQAGNDTIVLGTSAVNGTESNHVTVTGFNAGNGADADIFKLPAMTGYVNATVNTVAANNNVVEVAFANQAIADFTAVGDGAAVEQAIAAAIDMTGMTNGQDLWVVMYGAGGNSGKAALYHVDVTTAASEVIAVELVGLFNGITADAFASNNFSA